MPTAYEVSYSSLFSEHLGHLLDLPCSTIRRTGDILNPYCYIIHAIQTLHTQAVALPDPQHCPRKQAGSAIGQDHRMASGSRQWNGSGAPSWTRSVRHLLAAEKLVLSNYFEPIAIQSHVQPRL
jgi:hypothetical protein